LVHWPLMGGLLYLVQPGWVWAGWDPPSSLLAVPNVTAHPSTASVSWYDTIIASGLERVKVYTAEKRRAVHLTGARERGKMDRQEWQGEGEDVHTEWCQRRCVVRVPGQRGQQGWTRTCVRFFALSQIRSDQFSFYLLRLFLYENSALNFFTVFFSP